MQAAYDAAKDKLDTERKTLSRFDKQLETLEAVVKDAKEGMSLIDINLTKIEHDIQNIDKDISNTRHHIANHEKQNPWILDDNS